MFDSKLVNKKLVSAQGIENKWSDILLSPCNLIDQKQLVCLAYSSVWNSPSTFRVSPRDTVDQNSSRKKHFSCLRPAFSLQAKTQFWVLVCLSKYNKNPSSWNTQPAPREDNYLELVTDWDVTDVMEKKTNTIFLEQSWHWTVFTSIFVTDTLVISRDISGHCYAKS